MKAVGVVLSTVLAAIGIIVYAQSYGFLQLYMAPLMMAFPAVAAILIGGASLQRATIFNVIIGTVLFQTLLTTALPVTSRVIQGDISEVARLIISNGMILYALTRSTGGK
jgi:simple sugar transport system permease protein